MTTDKRNKTQPIPEDLDKVLNSRQLAALEVIRSLGWKLKFVRRPMFQEAQPVVYNAKLDQIGTLDPDGNIDIKMDLNVRTSEPEQITRPAAPHPPEKEKRKGMKPIPENLDELLNQCQLRALRQIETFGWQLYFVRRPLFQEAVPGIISPEGDKVATLESDGRINLLPESAVRNTKTTQPSGKAETATPGQVSKKPMAG